jgi:hypothetical protein
MIVIIIIIIWAGQIVGDVASGLNLPPLPTPTPEETKKN